MASTRVWDEVVSARSLGLKPGSDCSARFQEYINNLVPTKNPSIYFGEGNWYFSVTIPQHFRIFGDGTNSTFFNTIAANSPILIPTHTNDWKFHSIVSGCAFVGLSPNNNDVAVANRGYGVALGGIDPTVTNINLSFIGGLRFEDCNFERLGTAFLAPYGNIGLVFDHCSFAYNGYGFYTLSYLSATSAADSMHNGAKSFNNCRLAYNIVGAYLNNTMGQYTASGSVVFDDVYVEQNHLGFVILDNSPIGINPVTFNKLWIEGNGPLRTNPVSTVNIDVWTGKVRTSENVAAGVALFDTPRVTFENSNVAAIRLRGEKNQVVFDNCVMSSSLSVNGGPFIVDDISSQIRINNTQEKGGFCNTDQQVVVCGYVTFASDLNGKTTAQQDHRSFYLRQIQNIEYLGQPTKTQTYKTAVAGGTLVNEGLLFNQCNRFTIAAGGLQYIQLSDFFNFEIGHWLCTFNYRLVSGRIQQLWLSDGGTWQCGRFFPEANNRWAQAGILFEAKEAAPNITMFAVVAAGDAAVIEMSALQFIQFDALPQAQDFLSNPVYVMPPDNVHVVNQANTFAVANVVAHNGTSWVLADKDGPNDNKLVVRATPTQFVIGLQGKFEINHGLGATPGVAYTGDAGALTRTAPTTGELIVGEILDATHIFVNPEQRPFN